MAVVLLSNCSFYIRSLPPTMPKQSLCSVAAAVAMRDLEL